MEPKFNKTKDGIVYFTLHGQLHNPDGPAYIDKDRNIEWWLYGGRHRNDGPAVTFDDDSVEWWFNDKFYQFSEWLELSTTSDENKLLLIMKYS